MRDRRERNMETRRSNAFQSESDYQDTKVNESASNQSVGCGAYGLWFVWLLVNVIGMGIGWALSWRLSFAVPGNIAIWVIGFVSGAILGAFQWLLLRIVIKDSLLWILSSLLGWAIGFFLGAQLASILGLTEFVFGIIVGAVLGASLGLSQWLLLRRKFSGAGWWILFNIIAWSFSLAVYLPGANLVGFLYGGVSGAITGLALLGLRFRILH